MSTDTDVDATAAEADAVSGERDADDAALEESPHTPKRAPRWARVLAYGVLPAVAIGLAAGAGYVKWRNDVASQSVAAQAEAVAAATESTTAMLSYRPDTAATTLEAARDRLTGSFRDSYGALVHDVVIPGAQQKQISAVATIAGIGAVSAAPSHVVVLVFVNQAITMGTDAPTTTASSVRVTMDKIDGRWLISDFTPV